VLVRGPIVKVVSERGPVPRSVLIDRENEAAGDVAAGGRAASADPLDRLATIAEAAGAERIATEARELAARVAEGRFYVACIGQFKRGKSTLLNALVGDDVLPTGIVPITSVPTVLRYGPHRAARIRTRADGWRDIDPEALEAYVSEEHNPENEKGVDAVEVFLPSPVLASGMCLVDTPGLGSVFAGNTAATHAFVPHIDAALVVIGTEPPLAGEELALVEAVAREVSDLVIVLNKADRVSQAERDTAAAFARRVLERRLGHAVGRIYEVSATERLDGRGPPRDWNALTETLDDLVRCSGRALTRAAQARGLARLAEQVLAVLDAERRALLRPVAEAERHVAALGETVAEAEQTLEELGARFMREQHRLSRELGERRDRFLRDVGPGARVELARALDAPARRWGPAFRREAMDIALAVAKRAVTPWLAAEETYAEEAYRRVALRFVAMANEFLDRLTATGEAELAHLPHALDPERGLRADSRFYFHDLLRIAHPASPFRYLLDVVLGAIGARGTVRRDADAFLVRVLAMNAARVENDIEQRLSESRRQLEADIRLLLRDVRVIAERALARARRTQEDGAAAVATALAQLAHQEAAVRALLGPDAPRPAR
jgi:GTP-binding protein EngB required for normal cell division